MDIKRQIIDIVSKRGEIRSSDVVRACSISRQAAARHLRELVFKGELLKAHSTRKACYSLPGPGARKVEAYSRAQKTYDIKGLEEDLVFLDLSLRLGLKKRISPDAYRTVQYAFTEMCNNAIEHSQAKTVQVELAVFGDILQFVVRDKGIGVFENVRNKFRLANHFEAAEHVLKGKQTTAPKKHTGEGIFFTSRISDAFKLESDKVSLTVDNKRQDVVMGERRRLQGTKVTFAISKRSRKKLAELFERYAHEEFRFDSSEILVKLSQRGSVYVSRSQARRILLGLDDFKRVVFDFSGLKEIGQAFADEIFRVYASAHPDKILEAKGMNRAVAFLIERARRAR